MDDSRIERLYAPFELKQRKGLGGMTFDYISSDDVIDRMNKVFAGCWRTEVRHEKQIDDFILVRVRVHVYDPATTMEYFHDGYGSSSIARYNSGQNQGKMIDIGNAYKSAESMAIRNACTRFGVGLYLKEGGEDFKVDKETVTYKEYGVPDSPPKKIVKETAIVEEVSEKPKVEALPKPPSVPKGPGPAGAPLPKTPEVIEEKTEVKKAPSIPKPSLPTVPSSEGPAPPKVAVPSHAKSDEYKEPVINSGNSTVSDVQKAAIKGILSLKDLKFPELVNGTFEYNGLEQSSAPSTVDNLSYKEAIMVIKYGNEVFRQNR